MNLQQAYELSSGVKRAAEELTIHLSEYNPGRCIKVLELIPLSSLSFDAAIISSKLNLLRSMISNELIKGENE